MSEDDPLLEWVEAGFLVHHPEGWILHVHVQPGAKKTEPAGQHGDRLKVRLAAPPVDGKANKALIAWAAKWFGVSKSRVTLVRGQKSRQKTLHMAVEHEG